MESENNEIMNELKKKVFWSERISLILHLS